MPQKTVPSEETTAKIANTTTIKQRLTTPPKKRKFKALLEGDGVLVAEVRAHTHSHVPPSNTPSLPLP
jgi:hypothetical protein